MADNVIANTSDGLGSTFATDDIAGVHFPRTKLTLGADGVNGGDVSSANPMPVSDAGGSITVDGTVTANAGSGTFAVSNAALSITGGGAETSAMRVTLANDSTGVISVDDNGGSLTIDGSVSLASALPSGTNNIGDVDVLTQPARVATVDTVTVKLATDAIHDGTTALTPKFAKANIAASQTDSNIVTAVASKKIRVLGYQVLAGATATTITFNTKPAGAGSAISMAHACPANGGLSSGFSPVGFFETVAGEGLTATTGAGSTVGIQVQYVEV